jgi:hypothetical protein
MYRSSKSRSCSSNTVPRKLDHLLRDERVRPASSAFAATERSSAVMSGMMNTPWPP